jgi:hypothetical protein
MNDFGCIVAASLIFMFPMQPYHKVEIILGRLAIGKQQKVEAVIL